MTGPPAGARDEIRHRLPERRVALCRRCKREQLGTTTFESMVYGNKPVGHPVHFCDECDGDLAATERPLELVLTELLSGL